MKIILIAALNKKRVIGKDGKIPWHLPEDLKRFKNLTVGNIILMGRKTWESLGKALPNRRNIVISKNKIDGVEVFHSINEAMEKLKNESKIFIIGGGEIYQQFLDFADELNLTIVDNDLNGDAFFPEYENLIDKKFKLQSEEIRDGFSFKNYILIK